MIKIENLTKSYKNKKAIENINIEINEGDIFGFIGHNGAGKTTTIKCIVGILEFEEGKILINDKNIKEYPLECKKEIAYIPDNPDIYESLTGIQYLNFIVNIFKVDKDRAQKDIYYYADKFHITDNLGDIISTYSHGMKQKLVIISALIHNPKVMILDEPFVGLDPQAAFTVKKIMSEFCERGGCVLFSTHVLEVAEKICNKIAIIKEGKIVVNGDKDEIKGNKSLENVFMELVEHE